MVCDNSPAQCANVATGFLLDLYDMGEPFAPALTTMVENFDAAMRDFFASALRVARAVFSALERRLEAPAGWFEASYGPLQDHAQWHLKRYVPGEASPHAVTADGKLVLLPVHSDPSLISIVLHDAPGAAAGALGLEYMRGGGGWEEVRAHGHAVATTLTLTLTLTLTAVAVTRGHLTLTLTLT